MLKKIFKALGVLVLLLAVLLYIAINYSSAETRYECLGDSMIKERPATSTPRTVFVKLARYRWWVGLWSDSYGAMWVEVPNSTIEFYSDITRMGDQLVIRNYKGENQAGFSLLSYALDVNFGAITFAGLCHPMKE